MLIFSLIWITINTSYPSCYLSLSSNCSTDLRNYFNIITVSHLKVILFCHYCLLTSNVLDTSSTLSFTFDFTFTDGLMLDFVFLLTLGLSSAGSLLQSVNIMNVSLHVFWIKSCHNLLGKLLHFYQSTWYKLMILNFRRVWEVFLSFRYLASISHWLLRLPGICLSIFQCPFSCVMLGGKMAIYAYFREILVSEPTYSHTPHSAERALAWNLLSNIKKAVIYLNYHAVIHVLPIFWTDDKSKCTEKKYFQYWKKRWWLGYWSR